MIKIPKLKHQESNNFFLISGPCAIESEQLAMDVAGKIKELTDIYKIPYIFKGSFKKANRSKVDSFTGIGDLLGLEILKKVGKELDLPTTTDVHEIDHPILAAQYVDILQIPSFLIRQTDLLVKSAKTKKCVTLKKGQFLSPEAMQFAVQKIRDSGNNNVAIIERGTTFGYNDLVVDFCGIPTMKNYASVFLDVTHSLQKPNQNSGITGGRPELIETLAKAGIATGADGIFIETHPSPSIAKSDGANMLPLNQLEPLLEKLVKIREAISCFNEKSVL